MTGGHSVWSLVSDQTLTPAQDTRRMYQDELDMMEIELLGRERQVRLAAERAAAETSGRAELARVQTSLQVRVQVSCSLHHAGAADVPKSFCQKCPF